MGFDPTRAATRFGCGLSPRLPAPASVADMLQDLTGPDRAAEAFSIPGIDAAFANERERTVVRKAVRKAKTEAEQDAAKALQREYRQKVNLDAARWFGHGLLRRALAEDGFRERLAAFWADHFTAVGRQGALRRAQDTYVEEAIRPHLAGRFPDMLRAVATHPFMLAYLDQRLSAGPNSKIVKQGKGRTKGLNENLAREMLELHTLGVDAPYTQRDVRELAELLTGLSYNSKNGFMFRPEHAEPGAETVLGVSYGGQTARLEDIFAALDDLARHPATAQHIARKLAVHFVGDSPDPDLVSAVAARFDATGGDLLQVYEALLTHPAAWASTPGNVKQPMDFLGSSLRALDVSPRHLPLDHQRKMREMFFVPLKLMGQDWGQTPAPDGWPEEDPSWITPQRLSARMQWAMSVPFRLLRVLPDPRDFVEVALGAGAPETVQFAARAAETRPEGIGLVLSSPAFQRM